MSRRVRFPNAGWFGGTSATISNLLAESALGPSLSALDRALITVGGATVGMVAQIVGNQVLDAASDSSTLEVIRKTARDLQRHSFLDDPRRLRWATGSVLKTLRIGALAGHRPMDEPFGSAADPRLAPLSAFEGGLRRGAALEIASSCVGHGPLRINHLRTRTAATAMLREAERVLGSHGFPGLISFGSGAANGDEQVAELCRNPGRFDFAIVGDADMFFYSPEYGGDEFRWMMPVLGKSQTLAARPFSASRRSKLYVATGSSADLESLLESPRLRTYASGSRSVDPEPIALAEVTDRLENLSRGDAVIAWDNNLFAAALPSDTIITRNGGPVVANSLYVAEGFSGPSSLQLRSAVAELLIVAWNRVRRTPLRAAIDLARDQREVQLFDRAVRSG